MAILRLAAVRREIGTLVILDSVTAAIAHGEKVGLVGANGAGKTTLLRIACGQEQPDSGHVTRRKVLAVGLLAQEANLDPAFALAPDLRSAVRSGAAAAGADRAPPRRARAFRCEGSRDRRVLIAA